MLATALAVSVLAAAAPPACAHGQLTVGHGRADGTAGHLHWPLRFHNTSATACTLRGYPRVGSVSGRHGHAIGTPAAHDTAGRHRTVVLAARGGVASAVFTQTDVGVFDPAHRHPRTAKGLRVRPPHQSRSFFVALRHQVCSTGPSGDSTIRAVVKGSSGL